MAHSIADALAIDPITGLRDVDQAQWRNLEVLLGDAAPSDLSVAVRAFVPAGSSGVIGIFDDSHLWASLVVSVGNSGAPSSLTTIDGRVARDGRELPKVASEAVQWVQAHHGPCSLGLFVDKAQAETLLKASDKAAALRTASASGRLVLSPVPPALAVALA